jgi:hypothetical protein
MTDAETQHRFVCLRSQGWNFARIPDRQSCRILSSFPLSTFGFQFFDPALPPWRTPSHEENCTISAPFCTIFGSSIAEIPLPQTLKKCTRADGAVLSCKGLSFSRFSMFCHKNRAAYIHLEDNQGNTGMRLAQLRIGGDNWLEPPPS